MNKFFVLLFLMKINIAFTQDLQDVFDSFKLPFNWEKSFTTDSASFTFYTPCSKGKLAELTLRNNSRFIKIIIFEKWVLNDSDFIQAEEDYYSSSSCRNFDSNHRPQIGSFTTERFYIAPLLCPACNFREDRNCIRIQKSYLRWEDKWFE